MAINTNIYSYNNALTYSRLNSLYNRSQNKSDPLSKYADDFKAFAYTGPGAYKNTSSQINTGVQKYVGSISSASKELKTAMNNLTSKSGASSAYTKKTAVSSDKESLTASVSSSFATQTSPIKVKIDQVATKQENTGISMKADASAAATGYQQIAIDVGGRSYQVGFEVGQGDSNEDMQRKMADAINKKNIGVTASVEKDTSNNSSKIVLQSANTGESAYNQFSVRDVSGSAAAATGANIVTQQAQNALYSVNGGEQRTSTSNTVDVGGGVKATLLKASDKEITITSETDIDYSLSQVQSMVDSYNSLLSAADENSDSNGAARLRNELTSIARTYASSLSSVGIGVSSNGYMSLNKGAATSAIKSGAMSNMFSTGGSSNFGFASKLSRAASEVSMFPAKYTAGTAFGGLNSINFNTGLIFDFLM